MNLQIQLHNCVALNYGWSSLNVWSYLFAGGIEPYSHKRNTIQQNNFEGVIFVEQLLN